jgi:hypothetical protein
MAAAHDSAMLMSLLEKLHDITKDAESILNASLLSHVNEVDTSPKNEKFAEDMTESTVDEGSEEDTSEEEAVEVREIILNDTEYWIDTEGYLYEPDTSKKVGHYSSGTKDMELYNIRGPSTVFAAVESKKDLYVKKKNGEFVQEISLAVEDWYHTCAEDDKLWISKQTDDMSFDWKNAIWRNISQSLDELLEEHNSLNKDESQNLSKQTSDGLDGGDEGTEETKNIEDDDPRYGLVAFSHETDTFDVSIIF